MKLGHSTLHVENKYKLTTAQKLDIKIQEKHNRNNVIPGLAYLVEY